MAKRYGHIGQMALRNAMDVLGGVNIQMDSLKKSPKSIRDQNLIIQ